MTESTGPLPAWLPRLFPEVRDWQRVGPHRFRGVADPRHGNELDHVLLVCDPAEERYMTKRIADFGVGRTVIDLIEHSFTSLERKLATEAEVRK